MINEMHETDINFTDNMNLANGNPPSRTQELFLLKNSPEEHHQKHKNDVVKSFDNENVNNYEISDEEEKSLKRFLPEKTVISENNYKENDEPNQSSFVSWQEYPCINENFGKLDKTENMGDSPCINEEFLSASKCKSIHVYGISGDDEMIIELL